MFVSVCVCVCLESVCTPLALKIWLKSKHARTCVCCLRADRHSQSAHRTPSPFGMRSKERALIRHPCSRQVFHFRVGFLESARFRNKGACTHPVRMLTAGQAMDAQLDFLRERDFVQSPPLPAVGRGSASVRDVARSRLDRKNQILRDIRFGVPVAEEVE